MIFRYFAAIILSLSFFFCVAQEEESIDETLLEQLYEELDESVDLSEISERLHYYLKKPLDLNKASEAELSHLFFLSSQQIDNLIYHRLSSGPFISILELQAIVGFDTQLIEKISPFVQVVPISSLREIKLKTVLEKDENMLMFRYGRNLESSQGYWVREEGKSRYLGDANRYALRYRWHFDSKIRVAINMEKDAGEPFFRKEQRYGFDFYSGHVELKALNRSIKKLIIGDYALQFGQGLISWNGLSFGKAAWIGSVARQGQGLVAYSAMNESNFQRGIASILAKGSVEWTPFIAYNNVSGKAEEKEGTRIISTVSKSGLHRTATEQSYRQAIHQVVFGSNISYRFGRLKIGLTYIGAVYDGLKVKGEDLRERFDFEGKALHATGVHYNYSFRNYYVFGETAYSFGGGWATNNGIIASLHPKLSLFANYRNYERDYHTMYGQALGESSQVANERGVYAGLVYHPNRKVEWVNYIDVFQFPWLRYRVDGPSSGVDFLTQFSYAWYKIGKLTFRYRHRMHQENLTLEDRNTNLLAGVVRNQFRVDFQYKLSDDWRIRSRGEMTAFEKERAGRSHGFLLYQDVFWQIRAAKLQLNMRLAYFDTEGYDARVYAYENDVLYASSFPMYYDRGIRSYLNIRYKVMRNVDLWTRYAFTYYSEKETIGSGLDLIEGNRKSDVKVQLRWQW